MADPARFMLDTSALLALIEAEDGARRVEQVIEDYEVFIPFMSLAEMYYISFREQGEAIANERLSLVQQYPVTILWGMDEAAIKAAGSLKAAYSISLGDSVIAGLAIRHDATLLHKDLSMSRLHIG